MTDEQFEEVTDRRLYRLELEVRNLKSKMRKITVEQNSMRHGDPAHPQVFVAKYGDEYAFLYAKGPFGEPDSAFAVNYDWKQNKNGLTPLAFRSREVAEDWAEAVNVMLGLRAQPGACGYVDGEKGQHTIAVHSARLDREVQVVRAVHPTNFTLAGAFVSAEAAQAAIDVVGEDRIRKAAWTLAGVV